MQISNGRIETVKLMREARQFSASDRDSLKHAAAVISIHAGVFVTALAVAPLHWSLFILAAVVLGVSMVRLFMFMHDCAHGNLFHDNRLTAFFGRFSGWLVHTPWTAWRLEHLHHHGNFGDLSRRESDDGVFMKGDIVLITVDEYLALPWWRKLLYRLSRHPFVLLVLGPVFLWFYHYRIPQRARPFDSEWNEYLFYFLGYVAIVMIVWAAGYDPLLFVGLNLLAVWIAGGIGIWLFTAQHCFENTYWRSGEDWDFKEAACEGCTFIQMPRVMEWVLLNINYHHVHHLFSQIPNYRLKQAHKTFFDSGRLPYVKVSLWEAFRCFYPKLWDEQSNRMIHFREIGNGRLASGAATA